MAEGMKKNWSIQEAPCYTHLTVGFPRSLPMHLLILLPVFTVAGADPYMPGHMSGGGMQDMYGRPPTAISMSRSQYPYGPGYDRRYGYTWHT